MRVATVAANVDHQQSAWPELWVSGARSLERISSQRLHRLHHPIVREIIRLGAIVPLHCRELISPEPIPAAALVEYAAKYGVRPFADHALVAVYLVPSVPDDALPRWASHLRCWVEDVGGVGHEDPVASEQPTLPALVP